MVEEYLNSNNSPFKFNAKELDCLSREAVRFGKETGNYYYGARYYDPKFSIWLNVDPLAEQMPEWSSYAYTFNNPVNFTDPTGMVPEGGGCGCTPDCPDDSDIPKPVQDIMDFFSWFIPSSNKKPDDTQPEEDNGTNGFGNWAVGIFSVWRNNSHDALPGNKKAKEESPIQVDPNVIPKPGNSKTKAGKAFDFANFIDWFVDNVYEDIGNKPKDGRNKAIMYNNYIGEKIKVTTYSSYTDGTPYKERVYGVNTQKEADSLKAIPFVPIKEREYWYRGNKKLQYIYTDSTVTD